MRMCSIIRDQTYLSSWVIRPRNWLLIKIRDFESLRDWSSINHDCQEVNELHDWRGYKLDLIQETTSPNLNEFSHSYLSISLQLNFYIQQFPTPIYIQVIYDSALYILQFPFLLFLHSSHLHLCHLQFCTSQSYWSTWLIHQSIKTAWICQSLWIRSHSTVVYYLAIILVCLPKGLVH